MPTLAQFRDHGALIGPALEVYPARYPGLATLARHAKGGSDIALRDFARAACNLSTVPGVTALQVWHLAAVAEGWTQ